MSKDLWTSAKVGLLVVVGLALIWGAYLLVDETRGGEDDYGVYAIFDDAQGLVPKSRVLIAGIQVGHIDGIRLVGDKARVDIKIRGDVALHEDAWVKKESASILGESLLVINPGSVNKTRLPDGSRLPVVEGAMSTDDIMASVGRTAESVENIAKQMERAFGTDEGGEQMKSALENLSEALAAINRTIQQNEQVVGRTLASLEETTTRAGPKLVNILDDIEAVTGNVREIVGEDPENIETGGGQIADTVESINRASHRLEEVLDDLGEVSGRMADGEGTLGRLTKDERLINEVEEIAEGVNDFVGPISRLQTIVGLRSEYNFLANTFKNYVSLRLQPREDRYYLFELINDPRGLTEFTQTNVRRSPPADGEPAVYQETRVETRDAFRFSLMFAKRIHFMTLRFGILESTGGVGVDFHLLDDHLELTADAFAVGEQALPRLRARFALEVVSKLWILGGIDDAFNDSRDFFFGLRLRFNDEDLKSILPFSGSATGSI